jgi:hypothetical protein
MPNRCRLLITAAVLAIVPLLSQAAQNDVYPTDYVALPDGQSTISMYALQQTISGPWLNGSDLKWGRATVNQFAVRASRHFSVGDQGQYTVAPLVVLSALNASGTGLLNVPNQPITGFGDLRLGGAFWFHVDRDKRDFALAALVVSLPTGDYLASRKMNAGENRTKAVLSLGWMKTLSEKWVFDLTPEVAFFGDNPNYKKVLSTVRLSQDVAYALTSNIRYKFTPEWHGYVSAQVNRGGATQTDGSPFFGAPDNTRLGLGTLLITGEHSQIHLRYAQDVQISNGYRNDGEFAVRLSVMFD